MRVVKRKFGDQGYRERRRREIREKDRTGQKTGSPSTFAIFLTHFWWMYPSGTVKQVGASYCPGTKLGQVGE